AGQAWRQSPDHAGIRPHVRVNLLNEQPPGRRCVGDDQDALLAEIAGSATAKAASEIVDQKRLPIERQVPDQSVVARSQLKVLGRGNGADPVPIDEVERAGRAATKELPLVRRLEAIHRPISAPLRPGRPAARAGPSAGSSALTLGPDRV